MQSEDIQDKLLRRFTLLKNIEYYINESIYYRNNKEDLLNNRKYILWNTRTDSGKIDLYENQQ